MFGTDPGTLNLWMDDYTQNGQTLSQINRMLIWKANGSKGKKWLQGRKTIKATRQNKKQKREKRNPTYPAHAVALVHGSQGGSG